MKLKNKIYELGYGVGGRERESGGYLVIWLGGEGGREKEEGEDEGEERERGRSDGGEHGDRRRGVGSERSEINESVSSPVSVKLRFLVSSSIGLSLLRARERVFSELRLPNVFLFLFFPLYLFIFVFLVSFKFFFLAI